MTLTERYEWAEKENGKPEAGEIVLLKSEIKTDRQGREYLRRDVHVGDESDANFELKKHYEDIGAKAEKMLSDHPEWQKTVIDEQTKEVNVDPNNKAACWLYYDEAGNETQMYAWAKDFPSAPALEPLQRIEEGGRRLPGGTSDERTKEFFTYMRDGRGLRSRAHIYSQRLVELAQQTDTRTMEILSVGSGAAVPNIAASRRIEQEQEKAVNWHFYDNNPVALEFAHELIEEAGLQKATFDYGPVSMNPDATWNFQGRSFIRAYSVEDESVDALDALGLWEYLNKKTATDFAKRLYAKVKPGGVMIISNMLDDRPELDFNVRGVGWPKLHRRSDDDLIEILADAGIEPKNVTMTHADDGVYVVAEIQK
jgi:hypothetical protein